MQNNFNQYIFCKQQWKLAAIFLLVLIAITAFGGFYLFDLYEDDDYEHGEGFFSGLHTGIATPALQQKLASTVVGIQSGGDYASGVIVHPDGYIISVLHTIKDTKDIQVSVRSTQNNNIQLTKYKAEVIKQLPEHDIVLIKLLTKNQLPYVQLSKVAFANAAEVYALGTTEVGKFIMQAGTASLIEFSVTINNKRLTHLLQNTAVTTWEQNGGPMVNNKGELIGINLAIKDAQNNVHGLMIPVVVLMAHLQDVVPGNKKAKKQTLNSKLPVQQKAIAAPDPITANEPKTLAVAWWNKAQEQVNKAKNQAHVQVFNGTQPMATNIAFVEPQHAPTRPLTFLDIGNLHPLKLGSYQLNDILAMIFVGLIAGIMGVVTPLFGGLYMIIAMYGAMNYDFYLARPVIFMTMCFIYAVMTIRYRLDKSADRLFSEHPVILQLPWIIAGTLSGFVLGNFLFDKVIIFLLATTVAFAVINQLYGQVIEKLLLSFLENTGIKERAHDSKISDYHLQENDPYKLLTRDELTTKPIYNQWLNRAVSSFPIAFSAGMFAVYNGAIFLQATVNGLSERKARATSAQLIFFTSLTASIVSILHGIENELFKLETPFLLAILLIPPIFGGAFVSNHLLKYIAIEKLRIIVVLILLVLTALMITL